MILHLFDMYERRLLDVDTIESCIHTENADGNVLDVVGYGIPKEAKYVAFKDVDGVFQLFEVRTYTKDPITAEVTLYAENAMYELNTETPITDKRPTNVQAGLAVTQALAGTRWTLGGTIQTGVASTRWFYISPLQALNDVVQVWGIRLRPRVEFSGAAITGRYIDVVSAAPVWRGKRFEIGKDILSAKFTIDDRNVVTAIVPRGKGQESGDGYAQRIGIDSVTWSKAAGNPIDKPLGQNYIEMKEATALYGVCGQRPRFATVIYADIDNAEELCNAAYKSLQEVSAPTLCGDMTTIDLERIGFPHEGARYNDGVAFICEDMRFISTIVGTARQYAGRATADFSFGALYPTPAKQMLDIRRELGSVSNIAAVGAGIAQANPDLLNGIIDTSVTRIMSGKTNRDTMPDGSEIYTSADGTKAVRLAGGGILLASSKTAGEWNWRTAIDGGGIVADLITSGVLQASLIRILGTDRFYWDSGNIVAQNPENTNQQIRFGCYDGIHYGIAMTQDGGQTWQNCISFNGVTIGAGSITQSMLDPAIDLGGSTIYYAESTPSEAKAGDVWYDTANHLIKRWSGTSWIDITNEALSAALVAAGDAQATADGKVRTFAQATAPTGMTAKDVGDLWIDTDDNNRLYRWNGNAWKDVRDTAYVGSINAVSNQLVGLSQEVSAKSTVYYSSSTPDAPAVGDVWYDTANHLIKRWGGSSWADITNEALSAALVAAGDAQATADGKVRTFAQTSAPTGMTAADVGDLWIDINDNNKLYRWNGSSWTAMQDTHLDGTVETLTNDLLGLSNEISTKTTIFYTASTPAAPATGDVWYDTSNHLIKRWSGSSWADITNEALSAALVAAGDAQATADEKIRTFAQDSAPAGMTAGDVGDLWIDTNDNNKLHRWNGTTWIAVRDVYLDERVTKVEAKVTDTAIINTVTSSESYKATEQSIAAAAAAATAAQNSANDAASKAGTAQQTASNAAAAASNAQDSADGADEKARIAQQAAADAAAAASNAQNTANNANSAAAAAQNTANSTANSLTYIDKRVTSAEAKITADAIVQTVTSSTTYTNAMNGKQDTVTLISSINQSAEAIKIKANKIALEGTVTANNYFKINTDGSMEATNASISGVLYSGGWVFYSEGAAYNDDNGGQIQMISYNGRAYFRAINLDAVFGSTSYGNVSVYGGNITLDCASTGQSVSVRNGKWEPGYSYSDVCMVCDQAGSSYSTAAGNLGTTGHRWDVFWCDTVHYNTRDTSSSREVKHDIKPLADFGEAIDKLTPVSFVYNDDRRQRIRYGLIWEDTIDIMPDICHITEEDGQQFKGISYDDVITVLLKEVQSLRQRVARLEKQNS